MAEFTRALKTISNSYFEDDLFDQNSKAFAIPKLSDKPAYQDLKNRWLKMLQVCYVAHFRTIESVKQKKNEHIPHMSKLFLDEGTKKAHLSQIVNCILQKEGCPEGSVDEETGIPVMPVKTWKRLNTRLNTVVNNFTNWLPSDQETQD